MRAMRNYEDRRSYEQGRGEGVILRAAGSAYEAGRSSTLLKVKTFHDAEARVVAHVAGRGKHKGRLGALAAELRDGTRFNIGTGFSDEEPGPSGGAARAHCHALYNDERDVRRP